MNNKLEQMLDDTLDEMFGKSDIKVEKYNGLNTRTILVLFMFLSYFEQIGRINQSRMDPE